MVQIRAIKACLSISSDSHISFSVFSSFSAAGPHTTVNGKEVVNFASANYLGLLGTDKLLVRKFVLLSFFLSMYICLTETMQLMLRFLRSLALLLWKNMVLVPVVHVGSMGPLVRLDHVVFMTKLQFLCYITSEILEL